MSECLLSHTVWVLTQVAARAAPRRAGIYALVDPAEPNQVRYIGSSTHLAKRLADHCSGYLPPTADGPKRAWLASLKKAGRKPVMHVRQFVDAGKASPAMHATERAWIERFRAGDQADLNGTLIAGDRKFLQGRITELEAENAKLRALVLQHATAVQHCKVLPCCAATKTATQRNGGIEPVACVAS